MANTDNTDKPTLKIVKLPLKGDVELKTKSDKYLLPFRYDGGTAKIKHKKYGKYSVEKMPYESKIHINRALKAGDVILK